MSAGGLRVERLSVALPMDGRPVPVVREVSFALGPGETLGIVGESGSGKTMVALALTGLLPDEALASGAVSLGGRQLLGAPERIWRKIRGRRIGIVFQEPMTALNPTMPVGAQVAEAMRLHLGLSASEAGARSRALLRRVGMPRGEDWTARYPHQLSGG
ncbi:MAG: ATP-binding cassette domain-containing protein, partial [Geminicoccaceae bacterium]|nr:ATP-binding cassette domain-containing protein [Geminicoccaceae bacterium]